MGIEQPPLIPQSISPNGAEIWDWASKFSDWTQRRSEIGRLEREVRELRGQCGSCQSWMTRVCPKERNINGYNRGPSMNAPKCGKFTMKSSAQAIIDGKLKKIGEHAAILATPKEDTPNV